MIELCQSEVAECAELADCAQVAQSIAVELQGLLAEQIQLQDAFYSEVLKPIIYRHLYILFSRWEDTLKRANREDLL